MANPEHLEILKQGVETWNQWRKDHPEIEPDLHDAVLVETNLSGVNFRGAILENANLGGTDFSRADLAAARLAHADFDGSRLIDAGLQLAKLQWASLRMASLIGANFDGANLNFAILSMSHLNNANFTNTVLIETDFSNSILRGADFNNAATGLTRFGNVDLSAVKGLDNIRHSRPSIIGIDTLYESNGRIPEVFLRGCGVPEQFIAFIPSLVGAVEPFQYHSCFISYSAKDEEFAKRLHSRLRDAKVRVWFAPEDIKGGVKLYDQIERAIQVHDRLLLVLSDNSLQSEWVMTEIRKAREAEKTENRRKLFPIRLADFDQIRNWRCPDADGGKDLAVEVREYFIPDFSNWKNHDSFEKAFERLLRDLRDAEDAKEGV
jgi:hypothetical protein